MAKLGIISTYIKELIHVSAEDEREVERLYLLCSLNITNPDAHHAFVPIDTMVCFWKEMVVKMGKPYAGLLLCNKGELSMWGMLGFVAQTCPNIKTLIERIIEYQNTVDNLGTISFYKENNQCIIEMVDHLEFVNNYPETQRCAVEYLIGSFLNHFQKLVKKNIQIIKIEFNFPTPKFPHIYNEILMTHCTFGSETTKVYLNETDCYLPLVGRNPTLYGHFINIIEAQSSQISSQTGIEDKINQYLYSKIKEGKLLTIEKIAEHLNMSKRTLQRQLTIKNTSFSKLYKAVKMNVSINLLKQKKMSVKEISFLMGYNETSAFRKAFKTWNGKSPSSYL